MESTARVRSKNETIFCLLDHFRLIKAVCSLNRAIKYSYKLGNDYRDISRAYSRPSCLKRYWQQLLQINANWIEIAIPSPKPYTDQGVISTYWKWFVFQGVFILFVIIYFCCATTQQNTITRITRNMCSSNTVVFICH